jgi:hypothetical protein
MPTPYPHTPCWSAVRHVGWVSSHRSRGPLGFPTTQQFRTHDESHQCPHRTHTPASERRRTQWGRALRRMSRKRKSGGAAKPPPMHTRTKSTDVAARTGASALCLNVADPTHAGYSPGNERRGAIRLQSRPKGLQGRSTHMTRTQEAPLAVTPVTQLRSQPHAQTLPKQGVKALFAARVPPGARASQGPHSRHHHGFLTRRRT